MFKNVNEVLNKREDYKDIHWKDANGKEDGEIEFGHGRKFTLFSDVPEMTYTCQAKKLVKDNLIWIILTLVTAW